MTLFEILGLRGTDEPTTLFPLDGELTGIQNVDLLFTNYPMVRLHISLVHNSIMRVEPQIDVGGNEPLDFSDKRITQFRQSNLKQINQNEKDQAKLVVERDNLNRWLQAKGAKDLPAVNFAKNRIMILNAAIAALNQEILGLRKLHKDLGELLSLQVKLQNIASLVYSVGESNNATSTELPAGDFADNGQRLDYRLPAE